MKNLLSRLAISLCALTIAFAPAHAAGPAGGAHSQGQQAPDADNRTPEQRMNARHPQKVRVGDLIGLAILDYDDRTLGYVTDVVRTSDGNITLVMSVRGWFGRTVRSVPIPIETVAILARQINLLDIPRENVAALPTWTAAGANPINRDDIIRIAIGRR